MTSATVLTIVHTNDLHDRLTDAQAGQLRALKHSRAPNVLLLDAGDAIGAGNLTYRPEGEPVLRRMADAGYDAMAVGNREFHVTASGFACKVGDAPFPVLCANVYPLQPEAKVPCQRSVTFVLTANLRVGVFGLTVPMITASMPVRHLSAYVFEDPVETAAVLTAEMKAECDLVICLSHLGFETDKRLASEVPAIQLIVGGHSHTALPDGYRVRDTLIVQAPPLARGFGLVEIQLGARHSAASARIEEFGGEGS